MKRPVTQVFLIQQSYHELFLGCFEATLCSKGLSRQLTATPTLNPYPFVGREVYSHSLNLPEAFPSEGLSGVLLFGKFFVVILGGLPSYPNIQEQNNPLNEKWERNEITETMLSVHNIGTAM